MKIKITRYLFMFLLFTIKTNLLVAEQHTLLHRPTNKELNIERCKNIIQSKNIIQKFQEAILTIMDNLYQNRTYWQQAQYRYFGYFLEKGPKKWFFGKKQMQEIKKNLESIDHELLYQASFLGYLYEVQDELSSEMLENAEQKIEEIAKKILLFIQKNDNFDYPAEQLLAKGKGYKQETLKRLASIQAPCHFQRHWLGYSVVTLSTLFGYNYLKKNQGQINQLINETTDTSKHFFNDYIKEPIKNSIDIIYGKEKSDTALSEESILEREKTLKAEFLNYYTNHSELKPQEINNLVQNIIKNRALPYDMQERVDQESRNLIYNMVWYKGKIGNILYLKTGLLELIAYDRIKKIDRLMETNKLNFELLVALPATAALSFFAYLSYKVGYKLYYSVFSSPELHFKPLKNALLKLETILNAHHYKQSDKYVIRGQIYYWVHKLQKSINVVPFIDRSNFARDLEELTSLDFSLTQKLASIQRMFRAYNFLHTL